MFKTTFWLENLMKLICHELGNEYQHMFNKSSKKNLFRFHKKLLSPTFTYLKPKTHSEK